MIAQFEEVGIAADETKEGVQRLSEAIADVQREGSKVSQALRQAAGTDPQRQANMQRFIDQLAHARTTQEQYNIAAQAYNSIVEEGIKAGRTRQEATDAANKALPFMDPRMVAARKKVEEQDAEDAKRQRRAHQQGTRLYRHLGQDPL